MKKIILVRHGETCENVAGLYAGSIDATLTENGKNQIIRLAQRLKEEKIDRIFSSDQSRALLTASPIAEYHHLPITSDARLREKCGGIYESRSIDEYIAESLRSGQSRAEYRPPGGESFIDIANRAKSFLQTSIASMKHDFSVLVVAHGGFNRAFVGVLLGLLPEAFIEIKQSNTCVNTFEMDDSFKVKSYTLNCTKHLSEEKEIAQ